MQTTSLLAIEVGSSRVKLGWFPAESACLGDKPAGNLPIAAPVLAVPEAVARIDHRRDPQEWTAEVASSIAAMELPAETACVVAVVRRGVAEALQSEVLAARSWQRVQILQRRDIPLRVNVPEPDRVGVDRLLTSLAANRIRRPGAPAIVADIGTAMTVNLLSAEGVFEGGAILAGPTTTLDALHAATSSLPRLGREALDSSGPVVGKTTAAAMASGAYWGAIGAVRQLIERIAASCSQEPDLFLTGGAADQLAGHIGLGARTARHLPHLVLSGIHLAAQGMPSP